MDPISVSLYRLFQAGSLVVDLNLYIDQLTVLLLLLVTGVSSVVHVFSSRYMISDPRYNRFFAVIALFTFSMLMLVMSGNLLMLFVFWEVMGTVFVPVDLSLGPTQTGDPSCHQSIHRQRDC